MYKSWIEVSLELKHAKVIIDQEMSKMLTFGFKLTLCIDMKACSLETSVRRNRIKNVK